jgi:hypothetical protein
MDENVVCLPAENKGRPWNEQSMPHFQPRLVSHSLGSLGSVFGQEASEAAYDEQDAQPEGPALRHPGAKFS